MKALVIGSRGMLGSDLGLELRDRGHETLGLDLPDIDITDPTSMARLASREFGSFDWVINCAAYTAVDRAESEVEAATGLNAVAPGYLATAAQGLGARLMHISTDFVFDGRESEPYAEDAPTHPLGVYGRTKRDGEDAVLETNPDALVVRTAWLYGPNGASFPRTMIRAYVAGKALRVVADQIGCPTYTADLARVLVEIAERNPPGGIYHAVGPEAMSWHEFAVRTIRVWNHVRSATEEAQIEAIRSEDWPTPAPRPQYSALSTKKISRLGIGSMRPVDEALQEFCSRLTTP